MSQVDLITQFENRLYKEHNICGICARDHRLIGALDDERRKPIKVRLGTIGRHLAQSSPHHIVDRQPGLGVQPEFQVFPLTGKG